MYLAILDLECRECGTSPVVGIVVPAGIRCMGLCGPCFFGTTYMSDPDLWNETQEATE